MGSQGSEAELEMLLAEWQIKNQATAKYFAAAMAGLVGVFIIAHWIQLMFNHYCQKPSRINYLARSVIRPIRRFQRSITLPRTTIVPSVIPLVLVYLAINAALVFHDNPQKAGLYFIAKRFGWMTLCNVCLTIFLALKNTPLSFLAGFSYDDLNVLHRVCGYTITLLMVLHSTIYLSALSEGGELVAFMTQSGQIAGAIAGVSVLLIFATAIGISRRRNYELFYATHVTLVALILVAVGVHRPSIALKALIITIFAATMWVVDRTIRFSSWVYYGLGNYCTLTPLSDGATRIDMHRSINARPGAHAFLWIPGMAFWQRHPFTLMSSSPATFLVKAQDGVTRRLHEEACKNPGKRLRASVEGGYGQVPDIRDYTTALLFAGGSGVSFTMALARNWLNKERNSTNQDTLTIVWAVQNEAALEWFDQELSELSSNPRVNLSLHVTRSSPPTPSSMEKQTPVDQDEEKALAEISQTDSAPRSSVQTADSLDSHRKGLQRDRPNVESIITEALEGLPPTARVLIAGCGPSSLMASLRTAVSSRTVVDGPSIFLHCEKFEI